MADQTLQIHVGVYLQSKLIDESIHFAKKNDCHFFAFDLIDDQSENEFILYSDKASDIYSWNNSVVGKLKPNFDQLDLQLKWASHLSIKYLLAWQINADILNFSRKIYKALIETPEFNGEIWIPFRIIKEDVSKSIDFFTLIPNQNNIFPVLLLDGDIDRERLDYWFSKNVRCLLIKTNQFETNEDGDPILSNFLTKTVLSFLEREINILIVSDDLNDQNDYPKYTEHIKDLHRKISNLKSAEAQIKPYRDHPQIPLQPLKDDLSSGTYEVFERDSVKYLQYSKAITECFNTFGKSNLSLLIVGPGRGPLIKICLEIAENKKIDLKVVAVEKNEFVFRFLESEKKQKKWDKVKLMCSDIRNLTKTKMDKFDLIVSELLGSFGDNELSPEIIQIAEKFLNKDGKIIPQKYTSFLAPVSDETLWNKIENINISPESPKGSLYEMAIVSNLYKKEYFSEPKECYEFCHPLTKDDDLSKYCKLSFTAKASNKLDGFAGFFSAVLFDKIDLSINPQNYTKNMMSWFPMFFPLNKSIRIKKGEEIEINFWRNATEKHVWYEWCLTKPVVSIIHNIGGRSFKIEK